MRTLSGSVIALFVGTSAYGIPPRLWFSPEGVPEQVPITGTPDEFFQQANPDILAELGTARLYLWGTTVSPPPIDCMALGLDITVYTQAGTVQLTGSHIYNYVIGPDDARWQVIDDGDLSPSKVDNAWTYGWSWAWGFSPSAYGRGDLQFDPETDSMLLGYVDLAMSADARAEIFFLGVGWPDFVFSPPQFDLYFGWGDDPIPPYVSGTESALADARIVPEPAAALLGIAAALAVLRGGRRRRPIRRRARRG